MDLNGSWVGCFLKVPVEVNLKVSGDKVIGSCFVLCEENVLFDLTGNLTANGNVELKIFHRTARFTTRKHQTITCHVYYDEDEDLVRMEGIYHSPDKCPICNQHTKDECPRKMSLWKAFSTNEDDILSMLLNGTTVNESSCLSKALEMPWLENVRIKLDNSDELSNHKLVLAVNCDYFRALFQQNPEQSVVDMTMFPADMVKAIVQFMYKAEDFDMLKNDEQLPMLLQAAAYLQFESLSVRVVEAIIRRLSKKNVISFFEIAVRENKDKLLSHCRKILLENFDELFTSDLERFRQLDTDVLKDLFSSEGFILRDKYGRLLYTPVAAELKLLKYCSDLEPAHDLNDFLECFDTN